MEQTELNVFHGITSSGRTFEIHFDDDHYSIVDLIEIMGKSQAEFAELVGIDLSTLKFKIKNPSSLTLQQAVKICNYCNISPTKLYPPED